MLAIYLKYFLDKYAFSFYFKIVNVTGKAQVSQTKTAE